jgi:hypothetical protein
MDLPRTFEVSDAASRIDTAKEAKAAERQARCCA